MLVDGRIKYRKPGLSPGGNVCGTAMLMNPVLSSGTSIVLTSIRSNPEKAHANVAENGAEHGAVALDVKAPTAIFILMVVDVAKDFLAMLGWENRVQMTSYVYTHD